MVQSIIRAVLVEWEGVCRSSSGSGVSVMVGIDLEFEDFSIDNIRFYLNLDAHVATHGLRQCFHFGSHPQNTHSMREKPYKIGSTTL